MNSPSRLRKPLGEVANNSQVNVDEDVLDVHLALASRTLFEVAISLRQHSILKERDEREMKAESQKQNQSECGITST